MNTLPAMRADYVGSFLRPEAVKDARLQFAAGSITPEELKAVENAAIRDLVSKQAGLGFKVVTDGEFRRQAWHLDFMWGFDGVGHAATKTGLPFHGEQAMIDDTFLTGKVAWKGCHPFIGHFQFVNSLAQEHGVEAKLTIPSPAQFLAQMVMPFALKNTRRFYSDNESFWTSPQPTRLSSRPYMRRAAGGFSSTIAHGGCSWTLPPCGCGKRTKKV